MNLVLISLISYDLFCSTTNHDTLVLRVVQMPGRLVISLQIIHDLHSICTKRDFSFHLLFIWFWFKREEGKRRFMKIHLLRSAVFYGGCILHVIERGLFI